MTGTVILLLASGYMLVSALMRPPASADDYVRPQVGALRLALSTLTIIGAGEIVAFMDLSKVFGWYALVLFSGAVLGFFFNAWIVVPKIFALKTEYPNIIALPDVVLLKLGPISYLVILIATALALFCLLILQFNVGVRVFATVFNLQPIVVAVVLLAITFVYLWFCGYRGVLAADVTDIVLLLVAGALLAGFIAYAPLDVPGPRASPANNVMDISGAVSLFILGFAAATAGGDIWQRMVAAPDQGTARHAMTIAGLGWLATGALLVFCCIQIWSHPAADFANPTREGVDALIEVIGALPIGLAAVVSTAFLLATISTADLEIFAISSLFHSVHGRTESLAGEMKAADYWSNARWRMRIAIAIIVVLCGFGMFLFADALFVYWASLLFFLVPTVSLAAILLDRVGAVVSGLQIMAFALSVSFVIHNFVSALPPGAGVPWWQPTSIAALALAVIFASPDSRSSKKL